jgi:hypothetical protein
MNFTTRLNKILNATGIKVEATWCNVVGSYTVWCEYHNGHELKSVCLEGISRRTIGSGDRTADDKAQAAALTIVDSVLEWESR